jgi:polyhydroxybutyrate depolymerase
MMLPFLLLSLLAAPVETLGPGDYPRSLTVGDLPRTYLVHVPKSCDGSKPCPVVLVFHGGGSNAKQWIPFCGMNETSDRGGFVAVYPNGTGKKIEGYDGEVLTWNGGTRQPAGNDPVRSKVDDVAFTRALLDDLATVVRVDPKRVYATGMSMGGIMCYRLASELSDRIAAIAPIAGTMAIEECHPQRPVPVLHFHGTLDQAVPVAGGKGKLDPSGTEFYSVDHAIQAWIKADGCNPTPTVTHLPDVAKDGTTITRQTYAGGKDDAEVILYLIEGGGHTWPSHPFGPELKILGICTKNLSANDVMWEFFERHPMK